MYTRDQYMSGEVSYEDYYGQFVSQTVLTLVDQSIGFDKIIHSTDNFFNDIPMRHWDRLVPIIKVLCLDKLRTTYEGYSIAACICIAKRAASMIRENFHKSVKNFTDEE